MLCYRAIETHPIKLDIAVRMEEWITFFLDRLRTVWKNSSMQSFVIDFSIRFLHPVIVCHRRVGLVGYSPVIKLFQLKFRLLKPQVNTRQYRKVIGVVTNRS